MVPVLAEQVQRMNSLEINSLINISTYNDFFESLIKNKGFVYVNIIGILVEIIILYFVVTEAECLEGTTKDITNKDT